MQGLKAYHCMQEDTLNLYADLKDMLDYLRTIHSNQNHVTAAKYQF